MNKWHHSVMIILPETFILQDDNLPHPYGTCGEDATPQSDCLRSCDTAQAQSICGCSDLFMQSSGINGNPIFFSFLIIYIN